MSVIFSAILLSLNSVASRALSAMEHAAPVSLSIELSQDGETLWLENRVYDYAGFRCDGSFSPAIDGRMYPSVGRHIGYIESESADVYRIDTVGGDYVLVRRYGEEGDIYKAR